MFRTAIATLFLISAATNACGDTGKALVATETNSGAPTFSCTAPKGLVAEISGILPLDAYVARAKASFDGDYVRAFYQLNGRVEVQGDHMIASDPDAAAICQKIEAGDASPELKTAFEAAISQDEYWWPAKWTPKALGGTDFLTGDQTESVVYLSAKYVSFVTEDAWRKAQPDLSHGTLPLDEHHVELPIISADALDTTHAKIVAQGTPDALGYCLYAFAWYGSPFEWRGESTATLKARDPSSGIVDGVWSGCRTGEESQMMEPKPGDIYEATANCVTGQMTLPHMGLLDRNIAGTIDVDIDVLDSSGIGAGGGIAERFIALCPKTAKRRYDAACAAGDELACERNN